MRRCGVSRDRCERARARTFATVIMFAAVAGCGLHRVGCAVRMLLLRRFDVRSREREIACENSGEEQDEKQPRIAGEATHGEEGSASLLFSSFLRRQEPRTYGFLRVLARLCSERGSTAAVLVGAGFLPPQE